MPDDESAAAPARRRGLFLAMLALCVAGLGASIDLTVVHVRACQDLAARSYCAFNEQFDCDAVARSAYSVLLRVPVSVWGMVGYVVMGLVAFWGWRGRRTAAPTGLMLPLTVFSAVISAVLGVISVVEITTICVVCFTSYAINAALLVLCLVQVRRDGLGASLQAAVAAVRSDLRRSAVVAALGALVVGGLIWRYPQYWVTAAQASKIGAVAEAALVTIDGLAAGVTEEGHHWIGAQNPELVIEEFSDYECPHCENAHHIMRALVAANPDAVRLIHRHYPLDNACNPMIQQVFHPRACAYAAIAACAGEQEKFWQANDYLFAHGKVEGPFSVVDMCAAIGIDDQRLKECMEQRAAKHLEPDLREGIRLQIPGTPTLKINGKLYMGELPQDLLGPYLKRLEQKLEAEQP